MADSVDGRKKKKIIIIVCCAVLVLLIAAAAVLIPLLTRRADAEEAPFFKDIADASNTVNHQYDNWAVYPGDPSMKIDGELDEPQWQGKNYYHDTYLNNETGALPSYSITAFPTEYGVYVASELTDTNLRLLGRFGDRSYTMSSHWFLRIAAVSPGDSPLVNNDLTRLKEFYIWMNADIFTKVEGVDRAVKVKGKLNSEQTEGAVLEAFFPWKTLGIDTSLGIPEQIGIYSTYYGFTPGNDQAEEMVHNLTHVYEYTSYPQYDKNGYTNADREGAVVGDGKFGYAKNPTWDVSNEKNGVVRSVGDGEYSQIFFRDHFGPNFIVDVRLVPVKDHHNSGAAAGILFQALNGNYHAVFLDLKPAAMLNGPGGTKNFSAYNLRTINNEDNRWTNRVPSVETARITDPATTLGVRLTVVKRGAAFWYFCDGKFLYAETIPHVDMDVMPGFYSLGADVIYRDYSCKPATNEEITSYLNKAGVYTVETDADASAGTVSTVPSVKRGGDYEITFRTKPGYTISSILINGTNRTAEARAAAVKGVWKVTGVTSNQKVVIKYSKVTGSAYNARVTDSKGGIAASYTMEGVSDPLLYYEGTVGTDGNLSAAVPRGTYKLNVFSSGLKGFVQTVTVPSAKGSFSLSPSDFAASVRASNGTATSSPSAWDTSNEGGGVVYCSWNNGTGKLAPNFFKQTAKDFCITMTLSYSTDFKPGTTYQDWLGGGVYLSDGKNTGWVVCWYDGFVTPDWNRVACGAVTGGPRLVWPNPQNNLEFTVVKVGGNVSVFFDGKLGSTVPLSKVGASLDANANLAIGLVMVSDKPADLEVKNYSLSTGTAAALSYLSGHSGGSGSTTQKTEPLPGNNMFSSQTVLSSGGVARSNVAKWTVSGSSVSGSFAAGTSRQPLYFCQTGKTALLQAKIEYTTSFGSGDYEENPRAGFCFYDGVNTGYLLVNGNSIYRTADIPDSGVLPDTYLTHKADSPTPKAVKLTVAVQGNTVTCYVDDKKVREYGVPMLVSSNPADIAYGLYMWAPNSKTCDIRFSEISISTDSATVNGYVSAHAASLTGAGDRVLATELPVAYVEPKDRKFTA